MEENQEVFLSMKNEIEKQSQREVDAIMAEVKKMEEEAKAEKSGSEPPNPKS